MNTFRWNSACKCRRSVCFSAPNLTFIGNRGSVQEPPKSQHLPKIVVLGHWKPTQWTLSDEIWHVSVVVRSASGHQIWPLSVSSCCLMHWFGIHLYRMIFVSVLLSHYPKWNMVISILLCWYVQRHHCHPCVIQVVWICSLCAKNPAQSMRTPAGDGQTLGNSIRHVRHAVKTAPNITEGCLLWTRPNLI